MGGEEKSSVLDILNLAMDMDNVDIDKKIQSEDRLLGKAHI